MSDVISIIALFVVPVFTVLVGRWLQDRSELRRDKMQVFKASYDIRYGSWPRESVEALNGIQIVFFGQYGKEPEVRKRICKEKS